MDEIPDKYDGTDKYERKSKYKSIMHPEEPAPAKVEIPQIIQIDKKEKENDYPTSSRSWGGQILDVLFSVFIISIVFGVLLVAVTITGNTIAQVNSAATTARAPSLAGAGGALAVAQNQTVITENVIALQTSAFTQMAGYTSTMANFVGIVVLLAIIAVVIGMMYYLFGTSGRSSIGGVFDA